MKKLMIASVVGIIMSSCNDKEDAMVLGDLVPTQEYTVSLRSDTIVELKSGGKILLEAVNFNSADSLKISVKEFLTLTDMILFNLSTTSDDKLLETAGMFFIEFYAMDNTKRTDVKYSIMFPTQNKDESMRLYLANREDNRETINWQQADSSEYTRAVDILALGIAPARMTQRQYKALGYESHPEQVTDIDALRLSKMGLLDNFRRDTVIRFGNLEIENEEIKNYYIFNVPPGYNYINFDKETDFDNFVEIEIHHRNEKLEGAQYLICFKSLKSINSQVDNDDAYTTRFKMEKIPNNEDVYLIIISTKNNNVLYAIKEINTSIGQLKIEHFTESSYKEFQKTVEVKLGVDNSI